MAGHPESTVYHRVDPEVENKLGVAEMLILRSTEVEQGHRLLMSTLLQGSLGRRRGFAQSGATIDE